MGEATRAAQERVIAARGALASEVDELGVPVRSAVDLPAKARRNPARTAGLAGGAAFLALGGPKRVLKAVERRVAPKRSQRLKGILPKEVDRALDRLGGDASKVRENLEADFYDWMNKRRSKDAPSSARQSFWKTYDALLGPVAALGAKRLVQRLFAPEPDAAAKADREGSSYADIVTAKAGQKVSEKSG